MIMSGSVSFNCSVVVTPVVTAMVLTPRARYLGFFGLSIATLKDLTAKYGPIAYQYGVLLIGMLPLSIGFTIGLIIGFLFG